MTTMIDASVNCELKSVICFLQAEQLLLKSIAKQAKCLSVDIFSLISILLKSTIYYYYYY